MAINIAGPSAVKSGYTSRWFSSSNPVPFTFTRTASEANFMYAFYATDGTTLLTASGNELKSRPMPFLGGNSITVDLSGWFDVLLSTDNDSEAGRNVAPTQSDNSFKAFKIGVKVSTDGSYTVDSTVWYAVRNAQQIGATNGANLATYMPAASGSPLDIDAQGAYLTAFTAPRLFWSAKEETPTTGAQVAVFWPTPAYIITQEIADDGFSEVYVSVAGTTTNTSAGGTKDAGVFYGLADADSDARFDYVASGATLATYIRLAGTNTTTAIAQLTYAITRVCWPFVPVKWLNELGSWEVWVFEYSAPNGMEAERGEDYELSIGDIATATGKGKTLYSTYSETVDVQAYDLSEAEARALRGIRNSPTVLICTDDFSASSVQPSTWVEVRCTGMTANIDREQTRYVFSASFILPSRYSITN